MTGRKKPKGPVVETVKSGKSGRPAIIITEEVLMQVYCYASVGATWPMIACKCGMGKSTLQKSPEAKQAYEEGIVDSNIAVGGKLFSMAMSGHPDSIKFWLKTRAGWRENQGLIDVNINDTTERPASEIVNERLNALAESLAKRIVDKEE